METNNDVKFYYSEKLDEVLNLKFCSVCRVKDAANYYANGYIKEDDETTNQRISEAETSLEAKSSEFLSSINTSIDKENSKIYIIQAKNRFLRNIKYIGFTCTKYRTYTHLIFTAIFRKYNIKVTDGYYSKYTEWANLIDQNYNLYVSILFDESNIPSSLLRETLMNKIDIKFYHLNDNSSILPETYQPDGEELYYLLKNIINHLNNKKVLIVNKQFLDKLNLKELEKRFKFNEKLRNSFST